MTQPLRRCLPLPFFLALMPLFFVLHGYNQNQASLTALDFWTLLGEYALGTALVLLLALAFFRRLNKAALLTFGLIFVELFFGAFHDALKRITANFFLAKYSVLLPLLLIGLVFFFLWLKKSNGNFRRFFTYLNLIFLLLLVMELPGLFRSKPTVKQSGLLPCSDCTKPDVYFILADGYADSVSLQNAMQFNNREFLAALRQRDFHIVEGSHSNYNFTPFSVASLFQMNYLTGVHGSNSDQHDRNLCAGNINHNPLVSFFREEGYTIKNFSIFNVADQPTQARQNYVLLGKDLIRSETFLSRLRRDLGYHLVTTLKWQHAIEDYSYYTKRCNEKLAGLLREETNLPSAPPRFVYTHLLMPHYPYYYDKNGRERPLSLLLSGDEFNQKAYVGYVQYCNRVFLDLIDTILRHSKQPPIIVFMGDHGFREYAGEKVPDPRYFYTNMNAVLLPNRNYRSFYPGLPAVNQFRALLNTAFGQHLPMLKDSSVMVRE